MTISIEKNILIHAVHTVSRFSERKTATLSVLAGIRIEANTTGIYFSATNLETGVRLLVDGSVREAGLVVLPTGTLRDIAASFSGSGSVTLNTEGDRVQIAAGGAKSVIKTLPSEDFPTLPAIEQPTLSLSLPGALIKNLISAVASCASPSTVRPELASILISAEGGSVKAVATDSFRLAERKVSAAHSGKPFSMLIPAKNAQDIVQALPDDDVSVAADEHQCSFSWTGGMATTRLVAAQYPDYAQIIPKAFSAEATVLKKDFEAALRRAAIFSDAFQKVRLGFNASGKEITLGAQNNDVGESAEAVAGAVSGEHIELPFNHRYLAAPLSLISAESLSLSAAGIGRPLVVRGAGDVSFLYLVMPMNQ